MNRNVLYRALSCRALSLGLATLALSFASAAATPSEDTLQATRDMAGSDAAVATGLQAWLDQRDTALLAQADGLITNEMRADAEQYAVARLVEADGLVSAQLLEQVALQMVTRIAAADGLVVEPIVLVDATPESAPAPRHAGAVLIAAKTTPTAR